MPSVGPEFGQLTEYVTEGPVFHRVSLGQHDFGTHHVIGAVLADYVKVFRIVGRVTSLDGTDLTTVIPDGIRTKINTWLANRGYPTVPVGWTYRQLLIAIRNRVTA